MSILLALTLSLASVTEPAVQQPDRQPTPLRLIELTGDELLDKLHLGLDGTLSVSVNLGGGVFDPIVQKLPSAIVADVLSGDLDADGLVDLYLVSHGDNMALLGDGQGRFREATARLGLVDGGPGVSAERVDLDGLGGQELLLHNAGGDVIFWSTGNGFERDASTPALPSSSSHPDVGLAALEQLVAQAAELLALDPGEELVLGLDDAGKPRVSLGARRSLAVASLSTGGEAGSSGSASGPGSVAGGTPPPPAIAALTSDEQEILDAMSIVMLDDGAGNLVNKTVRFTGVNVQVVNGLGATNGNTNNPASINPANTMVNGVGNMIVGYNELGNTLGDARTGSHNVVLGQTNSHTAFGGLLAGRNNTISGAFASVSGGEKNNAKARFGSISGGKSNTVKGAFTSVSGGTFNLAIGQSASISGGRSNKADGAFSSASGGFQNTASGTDSSVSGGQYNTASGDFSSLTGGRNNTSSGNGSSVSGGYSNTASGDGSSVSGGSINGASGNYSSISGGSLSTATGNTASVSGGFLHQAFGVFSSVTGGRGSFATGYASSVSGGEQNTASGTFSSVSGGELNKASGQTSSVSGGVINQATSYYSSVSGGVNNKATGSSSSINGGYKNTASGIQSSVSGGLENTASGYRSSVSGGRNNAASGNYSSVSGGNNRTAANADDWVAGTLFEDN